ncbi:MAG: hypothetical protein ABWZ78_14755 [Burkholderiaceae bacterium]|jgi:hypothetical protein
MARWWCVASTDPFAPRRLLAGLLFGLLLLAGLDPTFAERSTTGQAAWLTSTLVTALAAVGLWRRGRRDDGCERPALAIDAGAGLHRLATSGTGWRDAGRRGAELRCEAAWCFGPWQFVRVRADGDRQAEVLAFDRRQCGVDDWAALQRALVRARRRPRVQAR